MSLSLDVMRSYTELSDVEAEINGFVTYDRKAVKVRDTIYS